MFENINILNELKELDAAVLINTGNKNHYSVPENYFNNLADDVQTHVFINLLPVVNPYYLPKNYFEEFPEYVIEKIQSPEILNGLKTKSSGFLIPEGYFDSFAATVLNKIKAGTGDDAGQELQALSPFLNAISKENLYSVPDNYFANLTPAVLEEQAPARIIPINSRFRKWASYAAAACIAAGLFGGSYLYFNKPSGNQTFGTTNSVASADVQKEISSLSDDEIADYLKDNNSMAVYINSNDADLQPNMDVQTLLQNVSDEEIQQYLNQEPDATETGGGI